MLLGPAWSSGEWRFLRNEVPLHLRGNPVQGYLPDTEPRDLAVFGWKQGPLDPTLQGYLSHKKKPARRTLQ